MIRSESVQMIREKALEGKSAYRIAQELGISKNTAKKYMDLGFLYKLLMTENEARKLKAQEERLRQSKLPSRKTLDEFDFDFQPSIDRKQINELNTLVFVERKDNVLFLGPPGVGKTHLAIALGTKAIEDGKTVFFTSLRNMAEDLKKAKGKPSSKRWNTYTQVELLIIDEVGYIAGLIKMQKKCSLM